MAAPLPTLRPYQAEAGRAIVDSALNRRGVTFTVVMARQAGKNELSAQVELFLLLRNARQAVDGVKAAPTFQPQCKLSMDRLWSRIVQSGLDPMAAREDSHVVRVGQARVLFLSAEATTNVVGHTAGETGGEHDATVLTIARVIEPATAAILQAPRLEVVEQIALSGVPHDELFARLADVLGRVWGVRRVVVDATGLGETLARLLERTLGPDVVRPLKMTSESKSRLGYELITAINSGRLRMYAGDGSTEYAEFWRQVEAARIAYRPSQQMNFYVDASEGHDDYLVSLALTTQAASDPLPQPRVARGRVPVPALN
jgi:hypothetical protein